MKKIPLTGKNGSDQYTIVDDDTYKKYGHLKWHLSDTGYAVRRNIVNGKRKTIRLHRLILNCPDGLVIDHLNGDKLDNRKSNLRICTQSDNIKNRHNVKGYCYDNGRGRWMVRYKNKFCGRYDTEEEAKKAYQLVKSGKEYQTTRRKYYMLPKHISRQFGKYRVQIQVNGKRYCKVNFDTIEDALSWRDNLYKILAKED